MAHRPASGAGQGPAKQQIYATATTGPGSIGLPPVGISASVGHDHWANDVLNAVQVPDRTAVAGPTTSGSNSPTSSRSEGEHDEVVISAGSGKCDEDSSLERKVLEKKRKFHTGRQLELKNLPDGCTEQVQTRSNHF